MEKKLIGKFISINIKDDLGTLFADNGIQYYFTMNTVAKSEILKLYDCVEFTPVDNHAIDVCKVSLGICNKNKYTRKLKVPSRSKPVIIVLTITFIVMFVTCFTIEIINFTAPFP